MSSFAQNKLIVQVKPTKDGFWGYANTKGELIIPAQYPKCSEFSAEGLAPIYDKTIKSYYFINTKGEKLNTEAAGYTLQSVLGFDVQGYNEGFVAIRLNRKWGYMDTNGKIVISYKYDDASSFDDGVASVKQGSAFLVIDTKGNETPIAGGDIVDVRDFHEGYAPYKTIGKQMGFIGKDGKVAIAAQFESVGYFHGGLAYAKAAGGSVGFINTKGEWVIKPEFASAKDFDAGTGLARAKVGEHWCYVNKAGERTFIGDAESIGDFSEGLAEATKNKLHGFINSKGAWAIEPQFTDVRDFKNGYAAAKQGELWGLIDKNGKWVVQPTFAGIKDVEKVK